VAADGKGAGRDGQTAAHGLVYAVP
jgi:hypothetical protein